MVVTNHKLSVHLLVVMGLLEMQEEHKIELTLVTNMGIMGVMDIGQRGNLIHKGVMMIYIVSELLIKNILALVLWVDLKIIN